MDRSALKLKWNEKGWEYHGAMWSGGNPPLPKYELSIGHDADGREWHARCQYDERRQLFRVEFDHMEENDDGLPFLRNSVLDAPDSAFLKLATKRYSIKWCLYKDIADICILFMETNGIQ